jgi:outer membrane protein
MKLLQIFLMFLCATHITAAQTQQLSLKQAIDLSLTNNVNVKNALLEEGISKQKVNELTGLGTPQITGSAELNHFIEVPTTFVPAEFFNGEPGTFAPVRFGQPYTASAGITATQLIFDGSYLVGLQASRAYQDLSRKQTKQTKIETVVTVSKAYYNVLVTKEQMNLVNKNVERIKKLRDDTKAYYDAGFAEKLDFDRVDLAYNNILVQQKNVGRYVELAYTLLKFQIGMDQKIPVELTDQLNESIWGTLSLPETVDATKRSEYDVLQSAHRLQELDLKRYRFTYLPSLAAFGSLSTNASRNDFNIFNTAYKWFPTAIIGASLSIPIWDGLQKHSRVQQSKLSLQKVDNQIINLQQAINLDYESSKTNLENNLASLETSKKNRDIATEIVRASRLKYDNGVGSSLEVIDAESSLKEAETNYFSALYETIVSKIEVDKALGNINY